MKRLIFILFLLTIIGCQDTSSIPTQHTIISFDMWVMIDDTTVEPKCPNDMVLTNHLCVDIYEYPNQKDVFPVSGVTVDFAIKACESLGKRLPTKDEWTTACKGSDDHLFGYGDKYAKSRCNDSKRWTAPNWALMPNDTKWAAEVRRLYQANPSGTDVDCVSTWGDGVLHDMVANVGEYVSDDQSKYKYVMMGCSFVGCYRPEPPSCVYDNHNHDFRSFRTYEGSFRCVKDL